MKSTPIKLAFLFLYIFNGLYLLTLVSSNILGGAFFIALNIFSTVVIHSYIKEHTGVSLEELNEEIDRYNNLLDENDKLKKQKYELNRTISKYTNGIRDKENDYEKISISSADLEEALKLRKKDYEDLLKEIETEKIKQSALTSYKRKVEELEKLDLSIQESKNELLKTENDIKKNGTLIDRSFDFILNNELNKIDTMNGLDFENYLVPVLESNGFTNIKVTVSSGDQGVDLTAIKNNETYAIQAKRYSNSVSNSAVQEVVSGRMFYDLDKALVITTNFYTPSAKKLAMKNNVELVDRLELIEMIMNTIEKNPYFGQIQNNQVFNKPIIEINK